MMKMLIRGGFDAFSAILNKSCIYPIVRDKYCYS